MNETPIVTFEKASWLRRALRVRVASDEYPVVYSGRSLTHERIFVDGRLAAQYRVSSWFRPVTRFLIGQRTAEATVRVWPWLTMRSFHLLIDGRVVFCDHRRDFFDGSEPRSTEGTLIAAREGSDDPLCPYCDRPLRGLRLDLSALPADFQRSDGPVGQATAVFSFPRRQRLALIVAGFLAVLVGIGFLVGLLFVLDHNLGFLGLLLAGVGPLFIRQALKYRRLHAVAGRAGVASIENEAVTSCRWQDISTFQESFLTGEAQTVLQASARGENHFLRVTCRDGTQMVFRSFLDDLPWLAKLSQRETLPYLLPPAVAALKKGQVLAFGPLLLDAEGLKSAPEKRLSWDEVSDVTSANGLVKVMQTGKLWAWFKTPLSQVPNPHVLLALVQLCRKAP